MKSFRVYPAFLPSLIVRGPFPCGVRVSGREAVFEAGCAPLPGFCFCPIGVSARASGFGDGLFSEAAAGRVPDAVRGFSPGFAPGLGPDFIQGCLLPPDLDMPGFWGRAMLTTISRSIR